MVQRLRLRAFHVEDTSSTPVRELQSHMPCGAAEKKKKKNLIKLLKDNIGESLDDLAL